MLGFSCVSDPHSLTANHHTVPDDVWQGLDGAESLYTANSISALQSRISYIIGSAYDSDNGQPKGLLPPSLFSLLFYRKDVFLSGNVASAPQSWDQLLLALEQVNGRQGSRRSMLVKRTGIGWVAVSSKLAGSGDSPTLTVALYLHPSVLSQRPVTSRAVPPH